MKFATINEIKMTVCGLLELPAYTGHGITHLISIWNAPGTENRPLRAQLQSKFPGTRFHFAFFDDVTETYVCFPPTEEIVREILEFTGWLRAGDHLLVHCTAGISRSTAVGFATLCQHWGPGYEIECFVELKALRADARPNPLVVQYADTILGRNHEMVKAIQDGPAIG